MDSVDKMFLTTMGASIGLPVLVVGAFMGAIILEQKQAVEACRAQFNSFMLTPEGEAALARQAPGGGNVDTKIKDGTFSLASCKNSFAIFENKNDGPDVFVDMEPGKNSPGGFFLPLVVLHRQMMNATDFAMRNSSSSRSSTRYNNGGRAYAPSGSGRVAAPSSSGGGRTGFASPSPSRCARVYKMCEQAPDPRDVLEKLQNIEIGKWKYIDEGDNAVSHISPYAEDFRAAFGVGDGKTLHWVDVMGVMMSSMQGLMQEVQTLRAELAEAKNPQS